MDIKFTEQGKFLIVAPIGEIDHHTSLGIRQKIEKAFNRSQARHIIFDFSKVEFMDSSGIGILIGRYRELCKQGGKVYAINISGDVGRIFGVSGLSRIIPCYDSLDDALKSAGGNVK